MWRGPVIARKKEVSNALKQKIFSMHSKLISIAARNWWDPDKNPALSDAIDKAKKDNVPNDNIIRAIKKWTWEDKSWSNIEQIIYEWYGPGWVAIIVSTLTDNKNRTVSNIRHIFTKYWWNMWEPWSVSFIFEKKWVIEISLENESIESLEELVYETNASDFKVENWVFIIYTEIEDFMSVLSFFKEKNKEIKYSGINYIANTKVKLDDFDKVLKMTKMLESFSEDEDVEDVYYNMEVSDTLQQEVLDFIEKNKFKT